MKLFRRKKVAQVNGTPRLSPVEQRAKELRKNPREAERIARELSPEQRLQVLSDSGFCEAVPDARH
jgi:hypothetical protein